MKKIGLLSDTHTYLHPKIFEFFKNCNEIWHAGDIGNLETLNKLAAFKPVKAVYGNIDGEAVRSSNPEVQVFFCEKVKVMMIHIGGYPGRYDKRVLALIEKEKPKLFISGHSHILKVMPDKNYDLLHINPGAAGKFGLHHKITFVRFKIAGMEISDLEVMELDRHF
ncbi:MAG: metallophosphatase family protein [Bacteroidales bacterium]|nr:metallophosphatase family protein [Bacteroidales bacterium]MCF8402324.1 metallophosphatase family protein [Bacteroidales bacterium]